MSLVAFHAWISGRVQGVYFRAGTQAEAARLGLCGWVRNLEDGRVEVWAGGDEAACAALLAWLRRGPEGARVSEVRHEPAPYQACVGFDLRPTA